MNLNHEDAPACPFLSRVGGPWGARPPEIWAFYPSYFFFIYAKFQKLMCYCGVGGLLHSLHVQCNIFRLLIILL